MSSIKISILLLLLPLIYIPTPFNPYEFPKFVVFVGAVLILLLCNVRRFWSRPDSIGAPQNDDEKISIAFKIDTLTKLVLLYGFVVYVADLLGIDPRTSFLGSAFRHQGFITLLSGIGLFLSSRYNFYNNYKFYKSYIRGILLGAFFVCVFALWQGVAFYLFHDLSIPTYQGRIVGTLGNPNSLAGYLVMVLPFVFFHKNRAIKIILSSMIVSVIIFTDSRSGFLAAGIIFLAYGIGFMRRLKLQRKIIVLLLFITVASSFTLLISRIYPPFKSPSVHLKGDLLVKERGCPESWPTKYPLKLISDIHNSNIFNVSRETACDNRLLIWAVGLEALSKRPILGFGQENFEIAVPTGKMHSADNAHNIFLETAMSSGLVGLIVFLAIIIVGFRRANFTVRLSLLAFLIIASFNPLSISEISLFWFLLGITGKRQESAI